MLTKSQQVQRSKENDARLRKATYASGDTFADRIYAQKPAPSHDSRNLLRQLPELQPELSGVDEAASYRRFYGQRRALQIAGYRLPSVEGTPQPEPTIPNELSSQRLRMQEQIINNDRRTLESVNQNPSAKIPAEPGQSGSSGVMRVNTGQKIELSLLKDAEPTREEIEQAIKFKADMEKAHAKFIADNYGKVASIEIGKESLKLPDLQSDIKKRGCRVREKDDKFAEVQCRIA